VLLPFETRGIYSGASITDRCLYPLYHANIFHALLNAWCLLSIVFYFRVNLVHLLAAYVVAILAPATAPTVGLSAVCYALMGMIFPQVQRKLYYTSYILAFILLGLFLGGTNVYIHIYSYIAGLLVGLLSHYLWYKKS
jgi:membrane associated rhomboid family serine protease